MFSGPPEPFVDADEVANFVSLTRRRILELARAGKLPAYPLGDGQRCVWRFRLSEIAAVMSRIPVHQAVELKPAGRRNRSMRG
jgi:hypothetical protein